MGTLRDQLSCPVALPNRLTDAVYHCFLANDLPALLEHMSSIPDGAPPHFLCTVRQPLNQTFSEWRIGLTGPVNWPALSPDLNPLHYWLWGHQNTLMYSVLINDLEVLQ